ncbi:GPW/gp25 family protein [Methylogaea oryzae]|uniref:Baseplate protein n=1 Tax=Methylogaea oryzae TaxID=1295382 RepID=A0A8D5AHW6_9GAMM|nr:GPW/gp25 family protein [Methylogaea oryzae]BBL70706.1 baseplate protein [Methylogaea oryzae]
MAGNPNNSFLGQGWSFPPSFSQGGRDVHQVKDEEDIQQSLQILLSTAQGERLMREDFGCDLQRFLFEEISQSLVNSLTGMISDAILYYEPRIALNQVNIDESEAMQGLLLISIDYTIRSTNSRYNMVYPFYLNEAVNPGT